MEQELSNVKNLLSNDFLLALQQRQQENKDKRFSKRGEMLDKFMHEINSARKIESWKRYVAFLKRNKKPDSAEMRAAFSNSKEILKPLSIKYIAMKMSLLNVDELYRFYGDCKESTNFAKYWWWSLDTNKH